MGTFSIWHWLIVLIMVGGIGLAISLPFRKRKGIAVSSMEQLHDPNIEAVQTTSKRTNFIAVHWRGEFPLWLSYWVLGFFTNILVFIFASAVSSVFRANSNYNPYSVLAAFLILWPGIGVIAVWQLVGVWRSANHYVDVRNRQGKKAPWGGLAKVAVILGALRLLGEFGSSGVPQIHEAWRMAFLGDPRIPSYALRVMRNGTEIEVTGGIKYGLHEDFLRLLNAAPLARVIHLDSGGGRIGEAAKLYKTIKEKRLITYVAHQCMSACTLVFAAGQERWISKHAKLGFHSGTFPGMSEQELSASDIEQRQLFLSQGISRAFVNRAFSTSSKDMWYPSSEELLRARVINGVADNDKFAASGLGKGVSRLQIAAMLKAAIPATRVLETRFPSQFNEITDAYYKAYLSGETERKLIRYVRSKLLPIIRFNLALANDETVFEYGKLMVEQHKALAKLDYRLCYEYAAGTGGSKNYAIYFSKSLQQRELALGEQVLLTSSSRPQVSETKLVPYWEAVMERVESRHGTEELGLMDQKNIQPKDYAAYCRVAIDLFEEILQLPKPQAVLLLRQIFGDFQKGK